MLNIRRSRDRLIFNMGVLILVRRRLYIEAPPRPGLFSSLTQPLCSSQVETQLFPNKTGLSLSWFKPSLEWDIRAEESSASVIGRTYDCCPNDVYQSLEINLHVVHVEHEHGHGHHDHHDEHHDHDDHDHDDHDHDDQDHDEDSPEDDDDDDN